MSSSQKVKGVSLDFLYDFGITGPSQVFVNRVFYVDLVSIGFCSFLVVSIQFNRSVISGEINWTQNPGLYAAGCCNFDQFLTVLVDKSISQYTLYQEEVRPSIHSLSNLRLICRAGVGLTRVL